MFKHSQSFARNFALFLIVGAGNCLGCSAVTRQVARDATPAAIDSGLEAGLSDENQEKVVEAIEPERVERASEKLTAATADGWTTALNEEERQARIVDTVAPMVTSLVHESMQAALSDEHLTRVRELAKQATLGFQDAIDEVSQKREEGVIPSEKGNVLEAVDTVAEQGGSALYVLGALAAVLAILLAAGVAWALSRRRRYEREVARRDQAFQAAVRMLAREGVLEDESSGMKEKDTGSPAEPADDTQADAELVRSAARRMRPSPEGSRRTASPRGARYGRPHPS